MISLEDLSAVSTLTDTGSLIKIKCFSCKERLCSGDQVIQLASAFVKSHRSSNRLDFAHYDSFGQHAKIVLFHSSCFESIAGEEYMFEGTKE